MFFIFFRVLTRARVRVTGRQWMEAKFCSSEERKIIDISQFCLPCSWPSRGTLRIHTTQTTFGSHLHSHGPMFANELWQSFTEKSTLSYVLSGKQRHRIGLQEQIRPECVSKAHIRAKMCKHQLAMKMLRTLRSPLEYPGCEE